MPKLNTTVKAVRVDNDKLAELEKRLGGQTINSWMNEQIAEYLGGKKSQKIEASPEMEEIESIGKFFDMSREEMLKAVCEGLMNGNLTIEDGKLTAVNE